MTHAMPLTALILFLATGFSQESAPGDSISVNQSGPAKFYFRDGKLRMGILLEEKTTHFVVKTRSGKIVQAAKSALKKVVTKEGGLIFHNPPDTTDSLAASVPGDSAPRSTVTPADTVSAPQREPETMLFHNPPDTTDSLAASVPGDSAPRSTVTSADTVSAPEREPDTMDGGDTALRPSTTVPARAEMPVNAAPAGREEKPEQPLVYRDVQLAGAMRAVTGKLEIYSDKLIFHNEADTPKFFSIPFESIQNIKLKRLLRFYTVITPARSYYFVIYTVPPAARKAIAENWKKAGGG